MVNIFKRQSVCIYLLFGPGNIDFEDRSFGLPFARVTWKRRVGRLLICLEKVV